MEKDDLLVLYTSYMTHFLGRGREGVFFIIFYNVQNAMNGLTCCVEFDFFLECFGQNRK